MKYCLSFGGGVNSVALLSYLVENKLPLDVVVFADTGSEMPFTYDVVERAKVWCGVRGIEFVTVSSRYGKSLYDYYFDNETLPSRMRRDCTSKFKIDPIRNYLRERFGKDERFVQYIGISMEEAHRMRSSDVKYCELSYPLVDARIDRDGCVRLCEKEGFLGVRKSGCFCCPFTKLEGWRSLYREYPELFLRSVKLEENCSNAKVRLTHHPLIELALRFDMEEELGRVLVDDVDVVVPCDVAGGCFL